MTRPPPLTGRRLLRALERAGYLCERRQGEHVFLYNSTLDRTSPGLDTPDALLPGTVRTILRQVGLSADDLIELLK